MSDAEDLIFVSIASYRDPQLVPTVEDCLRKALNPARVRVGICWQHGSEVLPDAFWSDERFRILDVPWRESRGACWARAEVMKLWRGETWFLQVDSHCRFKTGWDEYLVRTARALAPAKVVLSTYATAFMPGGAEVLAESPLGMAFAGFTPEGIPHMKPLALPPAGHDTGRPSRARFLSAGFLFAPGSFVEEVPYDPQLYFLGEEAALTVRAFTHGYDLLHPADTVIWHDYERRDATKHWDDHTEGTEAVTAWGERDLRSKARVVKLLSGERLEDFNLGTARTLADYEAYAGLSFRARVAQDYTMRAEEPPNPSVAPEWQGDIHTWMVRLAVPSAAISEAARDDASLWYVGVHDVYGNEIYRVDLTRAEVQALPRTGDEIVLICELKSGTVPAAWTVWPVTRASGWLTKVQGRLGESDYAILLEEEQESSAGA